ncbi:ECF-type sigma factor [Lentzea sp. HUAS12]|uniref:ECF-type sigma factor n=1 Tax=Lentzea sp. HUAS12 TaxID=2951806 RepID=UPI0020A062AD|nr:ECF-type sigma factor [Lentzea sp. HUAS12]USX49078.1 ECF-type sigma factor [Lentzea sp. HUAS12]
MLASSADGPSEFAETGSRLQGDAELCRRLRELKYQGPEWEEFVDALTSYGIARLRLLISTGVIFEEDTVFGRTQRYSGLLDQPGEADELIDDVVLAGFAIFVRKGLVGRQWDPAKGASLTTYFMGACKLAFRDVYQARRRRHRRVFEHEHLCDDLSPFLFDHETLNDDDCEELLDQLTDVLGGEVMQMFGMVRDGYLQSEIAEHFGVTAKTVERRIAHARAKVRGFRPKNWREA